MMNWLAQRFGALVRRLPAGFVARIAGSASTVRGRRLDPHLQVIARLATRQPRMHEMTPAQARAKNNRVIALGSGRPRPQTRIEHLAVEGAVSPLPARVYTPPGLDGPRPVLLYFHQGGYIIGNLNWAEAFCTRIAERARCIVISASYRLGPEHRFPSAQEDAIAIYRWLRTQAPEFGADPTRIAVGGDSAGGGLTASLTHALRRANDPQPLVQLLIYPWLMAYADNTAYRDFAEAFPIGTKDVAWLMRHYLNDESERDDPRISPLLERDFTGLAPAILAVAGHDPLCDEADDYTQKLREAGVPVTYRCYDELCHGFTSIGGIVPAADRALDELARDIENAFAGPLRTLD